MTGQRDYSKSSDSFRMPPPPDPPRDICEALGKEFLFDIGAKTPHRIGLYKGFGFSLYNRWSDGTTNVHIRARTDGKVSVQFMSCTLPDDVMCAPEYEVIRTIYDVELRNLKEVICVDTRTNR